MKEISQVRLRKEFREEAVKLVIEDELYILGRGSTQAFYPGIHHWQLD